VPLTFYIYQGRLIPAHVSKPGLVKSACEGSSMFKCPECRYCGRHWQPPAGVIADKGFCDRCGKERRAVAKKVFGLRTLALEDFVGPYILQVSRDNRRAMGSKRIRKSTA